MFLMLCLYVFCVSTCVFYRGSRQDMAAMASPGALSPTGGVGGVPGDHHTTLMEDPDVWRPT